jgi:hypothetical protein
MTITLGSITQGLGNLTPEVWSALGDTVEKVRDLEQRLERAEALAVTPPMFLAKITGYERVSAISSSGPNEDGQIANPKNVYLYTFEEVTLKYLPGLSTANEDHAGIVEVVTPKTFQGKRTDTTLGVKAVNLAEFGQPTSRDLSFGGIMLNRNQYPQVATVPTIHGSDTNSAGTIEPTGTGSGPIVVMHLVEGQDAEQFKFEDGEKADPPEVEANEGQKPIIPVFYSAINMDGACSE